MNVLIVRLGALGDIVHAVPAAAAIRAAWPDARIDWLVDAKHREMVELVTVVDRVRAIDSRGPGGWIAAIRGLRGQPYDWAVDFQGLLKSAVLARASGAARVAGFTREALREPAARLFYTDAGAPLAAGRAPGASPEAHVIRRNLRLLRVLGVDDDRVTFPLRDLSSAALDAIRGAQGDHPFALINPGAAWPNKRWPPARFGAVAAFLREVHGMRSVVLWGPGERETAQAVVAASEGAATLAPATNVPDVLALCRAAGLVLSGDTGPLHIAEAAGVPTVSIFGPTDPRRNGPLASRDAVVSRFETCRCHYRRRCRASEWCLAGVPASDVTAAVRSRLDA